MEDLLDGVVERFTREALRAAEAARTATDGDALARFNAFLAEPSRWNAERAPAMRFFADAVTRPGNDILFQRISTVSAVAVRPLLQDTIADGISGGRFDVHDVDLAIEAILSLPQGRRAVVGAALRATDAGDLDRGTAPLDGRMVAEGMLIDRMPGLPQGSVVLSNPDEHSLRLNAVAEG